MAEIQVEPGIGDVSPVFPADVEKKPMLLLDTTGTMTYPNSERGGSDRRTVLGEALGTIVNRLAGGLPTVTFADGKATSIGVLSPENISEKWSEFEWGGGTVIVPGWDRLMQTFLDEFGDVTAIDRPQMLALIVTDGEARDTDEFAVELAKAANHAHVVIAVMGYGDDHDRALGLYQRIAEQNDHVRVVSFGNATTPDGIANAVISLLGEA